MKSSDASARSRRPAVGRREHRVAGDRDHARDLTVARRLDLLGQAHDRELAEHLGQTRAPGCGGDRSARRARCRACRRCSALAGGGLGEHRAAGAVEVAGERVAHVDEPARERPELLGARADAAVHRGARRGRRARVRCGGSSSASMPHTGATASGAKSPREALDLVDARRRGRQRCPSDDQVLGEQRVHDREEEVRVGAGPDEQVLVGLLGGLRPAGVDDDELAAPGPQRPEPAGKSGAVMRLPFDANGLAPSISR